MVSITGVSSGQASAYYSEKDNYYQKEKGEWQGVGAEALGLSGTINREDFESIINGKAPDNSFNIQSGVEGEHRAGTDLTFSAPKSVSIASEILGDTRIRDAHDKAVVEALNYVEKHFSQARQTSNGITSKADTGNLVIAKFTHDISRDLDPQLHTHAVIANMTQRPNDGKWRALSNEKLFQNKMFIGQIYRNELAANLKKLGYSIQSDNKGLFEIKGIDQKVIDGFSKRKEQIDEKVKELKESGLYRNVSDQKIREISALGSRVAKKDVDMSIVRDSWNKQLQSQGHTKEQLQGNALKAIEEFRSEPKLNNYEAVRAAINIHTEHESTFTKEEILRTAAKLTVSDYRISDIEKAFNELSKDSEVKRLAENVYTTAKMEAVEKSIVMKTFRGRDNTDAICPEKQFQGNIKQYEQQKGFNLTAGQKQAAEHILLSRDRYIAIQGDAGTGKTTVLDAVREQAERQGYKIRGLAMTGKAASEIEAASGIKSQTVHSFLGAFDNKSLEFADNAKYQQYANKLSSKDWADLKEGDHEKDFKKAGGIRSFLLDTKTNANKGTLKAEFSIVSALKNRLSDFIKNRFHRAISKVKFNAVSFEKNKNYDVFYRDRSGNIQKAKQVTHFETDRKGLKQKYVSLTYFKNGDILKNTIERNGGKSTQRSETIKNPNNAITKGKEIWVVDEASMLSSVKMHDMMKAAEKADAKVVFVGDSKQLQSIEAGKMFSKLQEKNTIKTVKMEEVQRQKTEFYKAIVRDISHKKFDKAFDKLESQEKIFEVGNREKRFDDIVKSFTEGKNYKNSIIVTARNADRNELNAAIRSELKTQGKLSQQEITFTVRESKSLNVTDKHFAQSYNRGDRIISNQAGIMGRAGTEGKVIEIDRQNHMLTVQVKDGKEHQIDLKKQGQNLSVFSEKKQGFSQGDKIVFGKNDKSLNVKNGEVGEIKSIDKSGKVEIRLENGSHKTINLNTQYNYICHGFAVTDYKSQGQTSKNVIYHADASKGINFNQAYVAITRGKEDVKIFVDNLKNFKAQIEKEQVKTSTLDHDKSLDKAGSDNSRVDTEKLQKAERNTDRYEKMNNANKEKTERDADREPDDDKSGGKGR